MLNSLTNEELKKNIIMFQNELNKRQQINVTYYDKNNNKYNEKIKILKDAINTCRRTYENNRILTRDNFQLEYLTVTLRDDGGYEARYIHKDTDLYAKQYMTNIFGVYCICTDISGKIDNIPYTSKGNIKNDIDNLNFNINKTNYNV